jgi:hypothetical protein
VVQIGGFMRKVKKGQRYLEYGTGHRPFTITSVYGHNAKTDRGTVISVSRLAVAKYYELLLDK